MPLQKIPSIRNSPLGFSLIEILLVIALIAMITTLAIPAISSIGQARGVSEAGFQFASAIEQARAVAIARQTYVWLGIETNTSSGSRDLLLGTMYSKDGSTNTNATNLQPSSKALTIERVGIAKATPSATSAPASTTDISTNSAGAKFSIGHAQFSSGRTLLFAPSDEVALAAPAAGTEFRFEPLLSIGLLAARGTDYLDTNNPVDVIVDGSIGIPQIFRK